MRLIGTDRKTFEMDLVKSRCSFDFQEAAEYLWKLKLFGRGNIVESVRSRQRRKNLSSVNSLYVQHKRRLKQLVPPALCTVAQLLNDYSTPRSNHIAVNTPSRVDILLHPFTIQPSPNINKISPFPLPVDTIHTAKPEACVLH